MTEIASLRSELQRVRDERDEHISHVDALTAELAIYEGKMVKSKELEVIWAISLYAS